MAQIQYVVGDATSPDAQGPTVIAHICNAAGVGGRGFVVAISRRWPEPEAAYRRWHHDRAHNDFAFGATHVVQVAPDLWVANMIGQHGIRASQRTEPPIRYDAVHACLRHLAAHAARRAADVHMPRIGTGLAGGRWDRLEPLIASELTDRDIPVTVYDMP